MNIIKLYPKSWLYNASVYGFYSFYSSYDSDDKLSDNVKDCFTVCNDGSIEIKTDIFGKINTDRNYFSETLQAKADDKQKGKSRIYLSSIKGNSGEFPNFIPASPNIDGRVLFKTFVRSFQNNLKDTDCVLCNNGKDIDNPDFEKKEQDFFNKIRYFNNVHNNLLGGSYSSDFLNSYWNCNLNLKICHLCSFLLLHFFRAFYYVDDTNRIFINASSFKDISLLNKMTSLFNKKYKDIFFKNINMSSQEIKEEILKSRINKNIELEKFLETLAHNKIRQIEIVTIFRDNIFLKELDFNILRFIYDSDIRFYLKSLDFKIVNYFFNLNFKSILDMIHDKILYMDQKEHIRKMIGLLLKIYYLKQKEVNCMNNDTEKENIILKLSRDLENDLVNIDKEIRNDFNQLRFTLLRKIKMGSRDEVMMLIMKTFFVHDGIPPKSIVEICSNKSLDDETYRCLLYKFLSLIIKIKEDSYE